MTAISASSMAIAAIASRRALAVTSRPGPVATERAHELTQAPLVLVGHSHVPFSVSLVDDELSGGHAPDGTEIELGPGRRLCNPGSVGQPRDGDPRAAWLLVDFDRGRASFRRVPYDIEATQTEITDAGLPLSLAARLAHGV